MQNPAQGIRDNILRDAKVELLEAFKENFREKSFFGDKWAPRKIVYRVKKTKKHGRQLKPIKVRGSLLIVTGRLRRSLRAYIHGNGIRIMSDAPYASAHNEGDTDIHTIKSHRRTSIKGRSYKVKGYNRRSALPERRFVGDHPEVQRLLGEITTRNMEEFAHLLGDMLQPPIKQ